MSSTMYPNPVGYQALGQARRPPLPTTKTIPFDYAFQFPLKGERDNRVQDVVEISMEGVFIALSLGYSVVLDEQKRPRTFQPVIDQRTTPQPPVLVSVFPPENQTDPDSPNRILVAGTPDAEIAILLLPNPGTIITALPQPPAPPSVVAVASIGADGTVLVPVQFDIRDGGIFRVWDRTNNLLGQLIAVRPLDSGRFPTTPVIGPDPKTKELPKPGDDRVHVYGTPDDNVGLFLLRSTIATGPGPAAQKFVLDPNTGTKEVQLEPAADKTTLSGGDVVLVWGSQGLNVPFSMFTVPRVRFSTISLGAFAAGLEKIGADLTGGFRLNPNFTALATADPPLDQQAAGLGQAFETGAVAAEEASFRYSIDVVSTGRELQNKEIHNIAGLGIANGDRPFRPFAKPMMFEPRSSIRIQITEISGPPGTLFIVLQGYKMLGTGRIPG